MTIEFIRNYITSSRFVNKTLYLYYKLDVSPMESF